MHQHTFKKYRKFASELKVNWLMVCYFKNFVNQKRIPDKMINLFAGVIFDKICLWEAIGSFHIGDLSYHVFPLKFLCLYGCVYIVINISDFNIGKFSKKSPFADINSSPINSCKNVESIFPILFIMYRMHWKI